MKEDEAPALVRQGQYRSGRYGEESTLAAASTLHRQAFLLVEVLGLLAVDHDAVSAQQDVQPAIAEPAPLLCQGTQLLAKLRVTTAARAIAHARAISRNHPARPPLANIKQGLKMQHRFTFCSGRYHFFDSRSLASPPYGSDLHCRASCQPAAS